MKWLRWFGLLLILFHVVSGFMMGRFWTVLHLAHASTLPPPIMPNSPPPVDPMLGVWFCIVASLVALAILIPSIYFLGSRVPRVAPYLIGLIIVAAVGLPVLFSLSTPPSVQQRAAELKYLNYLTANSFFCVMGALLGVSLVALVDGKHRSQQPPPRVKKSATAQRKPRKFATPTDDGATV